jgi:hypothetical protein
MIFAGNFLRPGPTPQKSNLLSPRAELGVYLNEINIVNLVNTLPHTSLLPHSSSLFQNLKFSSDSVQNFFGWSPERRIDMFTLSQAHGPAQSD